MELIRIEEAAQVLRLSACSIRRLIAKQEMPYHRIGKKIFFTNGDIEQLLEKCAVPATEGAKE